MVALDEAVQQGIPRDDVGDHMSLVEAGKRRKLLFHPIEIVGLKPG